MKKIDFEALGFVYDKKLDTSPGILCDTKEKYDHVIKLMDKAGKISYSEWKNNWSNYQEKTVVFPSYIGHPAYGESDIGSVKRRHVYTYEEFLELIDPIDLSVVLEDLDKLLESGGNLEN